MRLFLSYCAVAVALCVVIAITLPLIVFSALIFFGVMLAVLIV